MVFANGAAPPGPWIWITRTEPGASRLAHALTTNGYRTLKAPVLRIEPRPPKSSLRSRYDLVIVVSEQAVRWAPEPLWDRAAQVVAIGPRTAAALADAGVNSSYPTLATAEGLLDGPLRAQLQAGQSVALVRGVGGRGVLPGALRAAGLVLDELVVYERIRRPAAEIERNADGNLSPLEPGTIGALVASSGDGLQHALSLAPHAVDVPVLVPSRRVERLAESLGVHQPVLCDGAGNEAVLAALNLNRETRALRNR
ncbi:MAG: uroporphyrinogen-III synthase [Pseudomonadota bacterium]